MEIRRIAAALVLASALAGPAAYAANALTKSGEIKTIDAVRHEVVLKSGETFWLPKTFNFKTLTVGEKVSIGYHNSDGKMMATKVTKM